jgi:hypothetical protein
VVACQIARDVVEGCLADQIRLLRDDSRRARLRILIECDGVATAVDPIGPYLGPVCPIDRLCRALTD